MNILFQFAPAIQALIDSGKYEIVRNAVTGELLGIVRDKATGKFVAHAVGVAIEATGFPVNALFAATQVVMGGLQMFQTHMGFQKTYRMLEALQNSVAVLQATTGVIGVGTVAGVALSAVNLHQTLKLREDVKQLGLEVKDGFIDMKEVLKDQGGEILKHIDQVAQDIEFQHHRTILAQAYGHFIQAVNWLRNTLMLTETTDRNAALVGVQGMLFKALADYNNPQIYKDTCAAGRLRRLECAWAIDQTITFTYQLQSAYEVVSDRLSHLQDKIRQDSLTLVDLCKTDDELDFLFPEIARICDHDLAVLNSWQNDVNWKRLLPPSEIKLLQSADFDTSEVTVGSYAADTTADSIPPELLLYENLKQKSHSASLRDQLKFMLKPDLRQGHESYISQQATASGYKALAPSNWQEIPNFTVANLYWYFKDKQQAVAS
jgi:hypothetical protein